MDCAFDSHLVMIAELTIKPERQEAFFAYTVPNLAVSRAHPGKVSFDMLVDPDHPQTVIFHEVWESADAQKAYMAWRVAAGDLILLMSFLAAPPKFTALRRIAAQP